MVDVVVLMMILSSNSYILLNLRGCDPIFGRSAEFATTKIKQCSTFPPSEGRLFFSVGGALAQSLSGRGLAMVRFYSKSLASTDWRSRRARRRAWAVTASVFSSKR